MYKRRKNRQYGTGAKRLVTGSTLGHTRVTMATQAWVKTLAIVKLYLIIKYETKEALRDNELFSWIISALGKLIHNVLWVNIKCIKICYKTCNLLDSHSLSFPSRSLTRFSFFSHVVITNCQTELSIGTVVFLFIFSHQSSADRRQRCENGPVWQKHWS